MRPFYNVQVILNAKISKKMLTNIFEQSELLGFSLMAENSYLTDTEPTISVEAASNLLITNLQKQEKETTDNTILEAQEMRTTAKPHSYFSVHVTEYVVPHFPNIDLCAISISPRGLSSWYKEPDFIDFDRYARILLSICKNYTPLWLNTGDEGFGEEFYWVRKDQACWLRERFDPAASSQFNVNVTIMPDYNYETLHNLLEHGTQKGWLYYIPNTKIAEHANSLSTDQAVNYILQQKIDHTTSTTLHCIINEEEHELSFKLRFNVYIMLMLKPLADHIDLRQTVLHALDLCTDFCIAELTTFDARYNYIRTSCDEVL